MGGGWGAGWGGGGGVVEEEANDKRAVGGRKEARKINERGLDLSSALIDDMGRLPKVSVVSFSPFFSACETCRRG